MSTIRIDINQDENTIEIYNNGKGIPVVMHKDENMYVPTMTFGYLSTPSNHNEEEEKVTDDRNSYGVKLCNVFSTKFVVETSSKEYHKRFSQTWMDNMSKTSEPKIDSSGKDDFTKITFCPDLTKFKMEKLEDDIVALMRRRAFDIAASTRGVSVYLNDLKLPTENFRVSIILHLEGTKDDSGTPLQLYFENVNKRWEAVDTKEPRVPEEKETILPEPDQPDVVPVIVEDVTDGAYLHEDGLTACLSRAFATRLPVSPINIISSVSVFAKKESQQV